MTVEFLANSEWGPGLGRGLTRRLSRGAANRLARWLADALVATPGSRQARAVRGNLAVVCGREASDPVIRDLTRRVFRNAAQSYVDLFRAMNGGHEALAQAFRWDPACESSLRVLREIGRGAIIVAPHTVGFDIGLLTLASHGMAVQALSIANPRGSYQVQNRMRLEYGIEITPISTGSLRSAIRRLRSGGFVLTGVDRPLGEGIPLTFFGREVRMSVGHVRLAQETGAPIVFVASRADGEGQYVAFGGDLLEAEQPPTKDGLRRLAQAVVSRMEAVISARPDEWLMFYPLWS
jgi:KDO2-lipid IV(A) lauroyltransferase